MPDTPRSFFCFLAQAFLITFLLFGYCHAKAEVSHPLEPVDTSSPRATLIGFLTELNNLFQRIRDQYWDTPQL